MGFKPATFSQARASRSFPPPYRRPFRSSRGQLSYLDNTGGTETAIASLSGGTLGALANSSAADGVLDPSAILLDSVTFHTSATGSVPITINLDLGGTLLGSGFYSNSFSFSFGSQVTYNMQNGTFIEANQGWVGTPTLTNESVTGFHFTGVLDVTDGETLPLLMSLQLGCNVGESCDLSHTAALSFGFPSNVSFTSASGVLPTGTSAPEPASFTLIGAGLVAVAVFRKRAIHRRDADRQTR